MILADNIQHLTENIGFQNDGPSGLYSHFTDMKQRLVLDQVQDLLKPTVKVAGKIKRFFYEDQDKWPVAAHENEPRPLCPSCRGGES